MGWLRKRFGEQNTAIGAAIVYAALLQALPQYAPIVHTVAGLLGVGLVVTPQQ